MLGCSGSEPASPQTGGTTSGGVSSGSGGGGAPNGVGGLGNVTGGVPSAGTASGGAPVAGGGAGGAGSGGGGRASGGAAGSSVGGAAGSGGGGSGGSTSTTAQPSAGCGKSGRPSNGVVTVSGDHIYNFPTSYDGNKPFPLLLGMHAAGNPIDQIQNLTKGSAFETEYVRAFPKSAGNEWVYNTDIAKVLRIYDELMSTYCIDKGRVFATGHSSGAQMIVQILTHADSADHVGFKAVAPVAASNYGAITKAIPVMYIQGKNDNVRNSAGADVVARFTSVNGCGSTTMAFGEVDSCKSTQNQADVDPGCVSYAGCKQPTIWCSHNDPNYSSTNHGWPCFATKAMYDFFGSLP
jgi:polyhydroxybutyrate depolymerase